MSLPAHSTEPSLERLVHSETCLMPNASIPAGADIGAGWVLRQHCGCGFNWSMPPSPLAQPLEVCCIHRLNLQLCSVAKDMSLVDQAGVRVLLSRLADGLPDDLSGVPKCLQLGFVIAASTDKDEQALQMREE